MVLSLGGIAFRAQSCWREDRLQRQRLIGSALSGRLPSVSSGASGQMIRAYLAGFFLFVFGIEGEGMGGMPTLAFSRCFGTCGPASLLRRAAASLLRGRPSRYYLVALVRVRASTRLSEAAPGRSYVDAIKSFSGLPQQAAWH